MTRIKCFYCPHTATHSTHGMDLCEYHYAKVDAGRASLAALAARDNPPHKVIERIRLVGVLEEMLGADKVKEILGRTAWFTRIEDIRERARLANFMMQKEGQ